MAERIETGFEEWVELVEYEYDTAEDYLATLPKHETGTIDGEIVYDTEYGYDSNGNLIYEFDHISQLGFEYVYYIEDLVTYAARNADGGTPVTFSASTNSYNAGELQSVTAEENNVTQSVTSYTYSYDEDGKRTVVETTAAGNITIVNTTVYDVMGRLLSSETCVSSKPNANKVVTSSMTCTYDEFGRMTQQVSVEGAVTTEVTSTYNTSGTVYTQTTKITEGSEVTTSTTTYTYDAMNRVTSQETVTDGHSRPTVTTYSHGQVEVDPLRGNTEMGYAQITTSTSGNQTSVSYTNGRGEVIKSVEAGVTTWYAYDKSGRKIASAVTGEGENLANAVITASAYDKNGNLIYTISDCTYDSTTKLFVPTADSIITEATYDAQGRTVTETDANGIVTAYTYDTQGRTKTITQDVNGFAYVTEITYTGPNSASNTTTTDIELPNGTISREIVDVNGNTTQEATIGGTASIAKTYTYTANGDVETITDSKGNYRKYYYDTTGRQIKVEYYGENNVITLSSEYEYDEDCNQTVMADYSYTNGASMTLYRYTETLYDELGRLVSEAEVNCSGGVPTEAELAAHRIVYAYDENDNMTSVTYPSAFGSGVSKLVYTYGDYDRLMNISAVTSSGTSVLRTYTYNAMGNVATITENRAALGGTGSAVKTYTYDKFQRPVSIVITDSAMEGVAESYTYVYDKNGQIVTETKVNNYPSAAADKINEIWEYEYDALGRLKNTTIKSAADNSIITEKTYTYDAVGNRLTETVDGVTATNGFNLLNQQISSGNTTYNYDVNGNLISEMSDSTVLKSYAYDADNRLIQVTESGTVIQTNAYNGDGQRIQKTEGTDVTNYFYQSGNVVFTNGSTDNVSLNLMIPGGGVIAAEREGNSGNEYYFYNKDMRASTTNILNESGTSVAAYEYSDFGETSVNSDFYNEICYTGAVYDETTGLYYLNARYYNPEQGRFLTEDTYRGSLTNPMSRHLYAYCKNNPVNYVDPSGHKYKWLAYGMQLDLSFGKYFASGHMGLDWLYIFKGSGRHLSKPEHIYIHAGGDLDIAGEIELLSELATNAGRIRKKSMLKQFVKELSKRDFSMAKKHLRMKDLGGASATFFCLFQDEKQGFDFKKYAGEGVGINVSIKNIGLSFSVSDENLVYSIGTGLSTSKLSVVGGITKTWFSEFLTNGFRAQFSAINKSVKEKALGRTALVASRKYLGSIAK